MRSDSEARKARENWLGGLDSNQDSQSQSLESYQLDDLPAEGEKKKVQRPEGSRDCASTFQE
jgi:hypothetical protein